MGDHRVRRRGLPRDVEGLMAVIIARIGVSFGGVMSGHARYTTSVVHCNSPLCTLYSVCLLLRIAMVLLAAGSEIIKKK